MSENPKKILVVEDDDFLRANLVNMLVRNGYATTSASDGEIAVRLCAAKVGGTPDEDYAVIICDYHMPNRNGVEVFESITRRQRRRFLLWTGASGNPFRACIRKVHKDIDSEDMLELIKQIISDTEGKD